MYSSKFKGYPFDSFMTRPPWNKIENVETGLALYYFAIFVVSFRVYTLRMKDKSEK